MVSNQRVSRHTDRNLRARLQTPPPIRRQTSIPVRGAYLSWRDLDYTIQTSIGERRVLRAVNGFVRPGSLLAIIGPSGAGKSSLLGLLGGRTLPNSGQIRVNGASYTTQLQQHVGFVPQDDLLLGTLTVYETLLISAELRLPSTVPRAEKVRAVLSVIEELGLGKVRDSRVGDKFVRGVSGGERKRVSIGQELVHEPRLLFADAGAFK